VVVKLSVCNTTGAWRTGTASSDRLTYAKLETRAGEAWFCGAELEACEKWLEILKASYRLKEHHG
jgi:hypothetical protein